VQNAARLLKEFGTAEGSLGVTELARRLGLGKSTVHRLLATLTAERILEHDPATGTYRLGLMMWELGARVSVHRVLHDAATTVIEELRNATKETVQVAVLDGRSYQFLGPQRVDTASGEPAYELTNGSAGGHVSTEPDPGNVQHPARFAILTYNPAHQRTGYAVVTVFPDASVSVSPRQPLHTPYAAAAAAAGAAPAR